ncbi:protein FAM220A [Phodopus roborovskii]|uniref:Fam220a protein n=1 Tax=Phodopus roborovskii TaxID=109678 RepID=A0AAV0A6P0_PHORO|nr:protein FAM220A [Phodopus roborovskii]CAH7271947.1 Fam220a [Phodopus roborovskii]
MRGGRGTLGTCLENIKRSQGGDLDKLSCGLKRRSQKGSPSPADVPSWTDQPAADTDGKSQDTVMASLGMKHDQSEADLILHSGYKVLQCLKESVGRNSAPAASVSKVLSFALEEHLVGVSGGIGDALGSDWLGRRPRAIDRCERYPNGESWVSGWPGHPKLREMGFLKGEPLSAVAEGPDIGSELSYPYFELYQLPYAYAYYEILPEDEARCVFLDCLYPMFSEQTVEYEETLSSLKSTSDGLQRVVGSLALQSSRLASLMP